MREQYLWVEKYRPKTIDECILPNRIKNKFKKFVEEGSIPNIMLTGPAGTGKTSVALATFNEIGAQYIKVNGSNEGRLIDTLRVRINDFASSYSLNRKRKYVFMDEADYMNRQSVQPAFRSFMEDFSDNCGFVFTCNYPNRIIPEIHSRFSVIDFTFTTDEKLKLAAKIMKRCIHILDTEDVEYDQKALAELIKKHMPDWRRITNELQTYSKEYGKIDSGILSSFSLDAVKDIVDNMKNKEFTKLAKWVGAEFDGDLNNLIGVLYDNMYDLIDKSCIPAAVVIMNEYQYKSAFVADQDINALSMLTELMMEIKFK